MSGGLFARLRPDGYVLLIVAMMVAASLFPARGAAAPTLGVATKVGVALVFFLHGARLAPQAVIRGLAHWRLHLLVLATTFCLFPVLALGLAALPPEIAPRALVPGLLFLACLPSTIQSSIGFTAIARGDVASAVAAATASNLLGVIVTPVLGALLLGAHGGVSLSSIPAVILQLLVPFAAGQALRPWVGGWVTQQGKWLSQFDRGVILLLVYAAFSEAVVSGLWQRVGALDILRLLGLCAVLLAAVLTATRLMARLFGFPVEDEIVVVFCGSKKSLASGAPMASALFPGAAAGPMLLPLMLFHQIQLMACAVIAQAYAKRRGTT